jgi:hypothetical protein
MDDFKAIQTQLNEVLSKRIVLITGATRWGTAWVQHLLDAHPLVCAKGEGHFTDILFPKIATAINEYNFEGGKVGNRLQLAGQPGNAAGQTFEDVDHLLQVAIGLTLLRWERDPSVTCIAEKTPEHVLSLGLLGRLLPEAHVIHVVRDGRDEAVSAWEFNSDISKGEFSRKFPTFNDFVAVFSEQWTRAIGAARKFGRENPRRYLEIRCEDIISDTNHQIAGIFRAADISLDLDSARAVTDSAWDDAPVDIQPGIWRSSFDEETNRIFRRTSGELLKLLGYEP